MSKLDRARRLIRNGTSVRDAVAEVGLTYEEYRARCKARGIHLKPSFVYTPKRVEEVKRRVRAGARLKDVCEEMGMDPRNLARWCRRNGVKLFTKKALAESYARRGRGPSPRFNRGSRVPRIVELIRAGNSDAAIADALQITTSYASVVRKQLRAGLLDEKLASLRKPSK